MQFRELFGGCICLCLWPKILKCGSQINERYSLDAIPQTSGTASPKKPSISHCAQAGGYSGIPPSHFYPRPQGEMFLSALNPARPRILPQKASSKIKLTPLLWDDMHFSTKFKTTANRFCSRIPLENLEGLSRYLFKVVSGWGAFCGGHPPTKPPGEENPYWDKPLTSFERIRGILINQFAAFDTGVLLLFSLDHLATARLKLPIFQWRS